MLIALAGGDARVGTTTLAVDMAAQFTKAGRRTLLLAGTRWSDDLGMGSPIADRRWLDRLADLGWCAEVAVIDVGNGLGPVAQCVCREADAVVLVTTTETAAVLGAFAAIKTIVRPSDDAETVSDNKVRRHPSLYLSVNRPPTPRDAETTCYRLCRAGRRLLGVDLETDISILLRDRRISSQFSHASSFHTVYTPDAGVRPSEMEAFTQSQ